MDDQLAAVVQKEHDYFEQVARPVRVEAQLLARAVVVVQLVGDHELFGCVDGVLVGDAVFARRRVHLHTNNVIRNWRWWQAFRTLCAPTRESESGGW
jgi:hypothetical protein